MSGGCVPAAGTHSSRTSPALKPSPSSDPQDTIDSAISRVSGLQDHAGTSGGYSASNTIDEAYTYLGLSNIVQKVRGNGVMLTYLKQSGDSSPASTTAPGGDSRYTLDAFGRVTDQAWITSGGINTPYDRAQYGYDRAQYGYDRDSNILYKRVVDPVNTSGPNFSELYHTNGSGNGYDNLNRLTNFAHGALNSSNDTISSPGTTNNWTLDAQGNWTSTGTQTRTFNSQNQITSISGLVTPTYDNNGNTTKDQNGNNYSYDAWNRLVALGGTNEVFAYDADGRRPAVTVCATTMTDTYYSMDWQVLEEDRRAR